jgi:two-component system, sensor histidine kinase
MYLTFHSLSSFCFPPFKNPKTKAHEIRNPLASALAALNFVSSKTSDKTVVPDPEQRALVQGDVRVIDSSLQFVNELLRNMLDLHRTSKGHGIKLHVVPTDVLKDILEPVASILYMRGASVEIITECHPPNLYILADRMRLKQILLNLSFNATKFVERGFIRLRANVRGGGDNPKELSSSFVTLFVEDSGPGIPQHKRSSLFTKFQDSLDVLNQGTGIGLALCKKLSVLMGMCVLEFSDGICWHVSRT